MESILRVYNMYGRRDNIHKARIKIIVNQMGIDRYRELVEADWEQIRDSVLKGSPGGGQTASTPISSHRSTSASPTFPTN